MSLSLKIQPRYEDNRTHDWHEESEQSRASSLSHILEEILEPSSFSREMTSDPAAFDQHPSLGDVFASHTEEQTREVCFKSSPSDDHTALLQDISKKSFRPPSVIPEISARSQCQSQQSLQESEADPLNMIKKLVSSFCDLSLPSWEHQKVAEALHALSVDPVYEVRACLARALAPLTHLNWELVASILGDVSSISVPFLRDSCALDGRRMVLIAQSADEEHAYILAQRQDLTLGAAWILAGRASKKVIERLLIHPRLLLESQHYHKIYQRFQEDEQIVTKLLALPQLPVSVRILEIKRLKNLLSLKISHWQGFSPSGVSSLLSRCETLGVMEMLLAAPSRQRGEIFAILEKEKMLTPGLILRSACAGRIDLVEHLLAWVMRTPLSTVKYCTNKKNRLFLRTLCWGAGLPGELFPIFYGAFRTFWTMKPQQRLNAQEVGERIIHQVMRDSRKLPHQRRCHLLKCVSEVTEGHVRARALTHLEKERVEVSYNSEKKGLERLIDRM